MLLNEHLARKSPQDCLSQLKEKKIIPVKRPDGELCLMDYDKDTWYLADRQNLWDCFNGKLPMINFNVRTVRKLKPLIDAMGLESSLLSKSDERTAATVGVKIFDDDKTSELRHRVQYFSR